MAALVTASRWQVDAYGGADDLHLCSFPLPPPPPGFVLVKVLATTATYTDQLILRGNYRPEQVPPVVPGYECVGEVVACGEGASAVRPGDRVAALPQGTCMATHVTLPEALLVKVRPDVPPTQAVCMVLTGVTAYQMLHRCGAGRLTPASTLLVHSCVGGTGSMLVHLAKAAGLRAENIFGTCSARNLPAAHAMGVTAFDYLAEDWSGLVLRATGGRGVDLVFDAVMMGGYYSRGLACMRRGGKYVGYGFTNSSAPGTMPLASVIPLFLRLTLQQKVWSWVTGTEAEFYIVSEHRDAHPEHFAEDLRLLLDMVASGAVQPLVGRVWPFAQAKDALLAIAGGGHQGKQVVQVAE